MPEYAFPFPLAAVGLSVAITDTLTGEVVDTTTLGSTTDETGRYALHVVTLAASEFYRADALDGNGHPVYTVSDSLDVPASLAAAGGGGVVLDGAVYTLAYNAGTATIPDGVPGLNIDFDTIGEGVTRVSAGVFRVPPGAYIASINDYELSKPAEDRTAQVYIGPPASTDGIVYPIPIKSSDDFFATSIARSMLVIIEDTFVASIQVGTEAGGGAALTLGYAGLSLRKIG